MSAVDMLRSLQVGCIAGCVHQGIECGDSVESARAFSERIGAVVADNETIADRMPFSGPGCRAPERTGPVTQALCPAH
jgi:hypothetical protein